MVPLNISCHSGEPPDIPAVFTNSTTFQRVIIGGEFTVTFAVLCVYIYDLLYFVRTIQIYSQLKSILIIQGVYVVYSFTSLFSIISPRSGTLVELVFSVKTSLAAPPLACCFWFCCPHVYSNKKFILFVKIGVYQTVFIRPTLDFVSAVLWTNGMEVMGLMSLSSPAFYLSILEIASTLCAMYASTLLFQASFYLLRSYNIKGKFICVQVVMILSAAQLFLFSFMSVHGIIPCKPPLNSKMRASVLQHCVVIPEMFILLLVSRYFYRKSPIPLYRNEYTSLLGSQYPTIDTL